jgi:hypothetical protein
MLTKEWDWDVAKTVWKEESRAEGRMDGRMEGIQIGRNESAEEISALKEEVRRLRTAAQARWR